MSLLRAFLASELPSSIQDAIQRATAGLHKALGDELVRWVPAYNIHLTLKFLGDISPANLDLIKQMLLAEAAQYPAFDVEVEGLGSFPSARRPRILWLGLSAPGTLAALQHSIEMSAARLGYEAEERAYSPHLTLGRIRQNASSAEVLRIRTALEENQVGNLGTAHIHSIHLFKSDLQPTGSVYTILFSAPLANSG